MGKRQSLQQMVLGKLDSNMQENETVSLFHTIHKNKFKMDKRPKYETENHQNPRGRAQAATLLTSATATSYLTCLCRQRKKVQN